MDTLDSILGRRSIRKYKDKPIDKEIIEKITEEEAKEKILIHLEASSLEILDSYLTSHKQMIVSYFENLWNKYGVDINTIEKERNDYAIKLNKYLEELGYHE